MMQEGNAVWGIYTQLVYSQHLRNGKAIERYTQHIAN